MNYWVLALGLLQVAPESRVERAEALRSERVAILSKEREDLMAVARRARSEGKTELAHDAETAIGPPPTRDGSSHFHPLPSVVTSAASNQIAPEVATIRTASAARLLALARKAGAAKEGRFTLAEESLRDAIARDPSQPEIRRLLGFVPYESGWATPFAVEQLRAGNVHHPVYGWVPASWAPYLEKGELPGTEFRGAEPTRWLPAEQADSLRADFSARPWQITTAHFELRSNVPLREAIAFERRLEVFYELFFALMGDVIGRERLPLARRLAQPKATARAAGQRHEVWYFADRSEYVDFFLKQFGRDESVSLGYTMPPVEAKNFRVTPRSYFFRDAKQSIDVQATLFHEVSHQILFESAGPTRYDRNAGHFWVWEGLGTYFETVMVEANGGLTFGGPVGPRIAMARPRLIQQGELIPIQNFVALNRSRFMDEEMVSLHYIEAMALALFLMHGEDGRYREGFFDYIASAYAGRLTAGRGGLDAFLEVPYPLLERQFGAFLETLPGR